MGRRRTVCCAGARHRPHVGCDGDMELCFARRVLVMPANPVGGDYPHVREIHPLPDRDSVAEFQFRYNNRLNADIFGEAIRGC